MNQSTKMVNSSDIIASRKIWTNEEIQTIINVVRSRPYLYDKKHDDYKHNQKKDTAWDEIAGIVKTKSGKLNILVHQQFL